MKPALVLFLAFLASCTAYRSGLDYFGAGSLQASFFNPSTNSQSRGRYNIIYHARSLQLEYRIMTNLRDVGTVAIHGPARCIDKEGRTFSQNDERCAYNTGPMVFKLGRGVKSEGEDLQYQEFTGTLSLNNVEEDMLFSNEMYILVHRLVPGEGNKMEEEPFIRGAINVYDHSTDRIVSFFEFEPYSSKFKFASPYNPDGRTRESGFGVLSADVKENTANFQAWTTIPGTATYVMSCRNGATQKVLASNENPGEENVNFAGSENMMLDYLIGDCFVFVTSNAFVDGELFAYPSSFGLFEAIGLGAKQEPPVQSSGLFYATITFDRGIKVLDIVLRHNLTAEDITAAHVHQRDGSVICDLKSGNDPLPGRSFCYLNETYIDQLESGDLYINVHTDANPGGELRGEIVFMGDATSLTGASKISSTTALALGIGLGVGIPLVLLAIVGLIFLVKKGGTDSKI